MYVRRRGGGAFLTVRKKGGFSSFPPPPRPTDEGNLQSLRREANFEQHFKGECLNVSSFQAALRCTLRKILRK